MRVGHSSSPQRRQRKSAKARRSRHPEQPTRIPSYGPSPSGHLKLWESIQPEVYKGPLEFQFRSPEKSWRRALAAVPCPVRDSQGRRCRVESCRTLPFCERHLTDVYKIQLAPTSLINPETGKRFEFFGIFAKDYEKPKSEIVFYRGQDIIPYLGEQSSELNWLERRYGPHTVTYGFAHSCTLLYTDSACVRGAGANINQGTEERPNNAFFRDTLPLATIVASRDIYNGEEIFVDYGENYLMRETSVNHRTVERH